MRLNFSFTDVKTEMQKSELIFICPSPYIKKDFPSDSDDKESVC